MTKFTATFASIAATLLLAGNAMAQMPVKSMAMKFVYCLWVQHKTRKTSLSNFVVVFTLNVQVISVYSKSRLKVA